MLLWVVVAGLTSVSGRTCRCVSASCPAPGVSLSPQRARSDRLLRAASSFPSHFNESELFRGGKQARKLKVEFRDHFRNISRIMDCVGCEKCKLWGTLQVSLSVSVGGMGCC